jgi:hypothetical protein
VFDFQKISEIAEARYDRFKHSGPRGQLVTEKDGPEYWYALVAYEMGKDDKDSD